MTCCCLSPRGNMRIHSLLIFILVGLIWGLAPSGNHPTEEANKIKKLYMIDAVLIGLYSIPRFRKLILSQDLKKLEKEKDGRDNMEMFQKIFQIFSGNPRIFLTVPQAEVNNHIRRHFANLITLGKQESLRHVYKKLLKSLGPIVWKRFGIGSDGRAFVFMSNVRMIEVKLKKMPKNPAIMAVQGEIGILPNGSLSMPLAFTVPSKKRKSGTDGYMIWETTRSVKMLVSDQIVQPDSKQQQQDHRQPSQIILWYKIVLRKRSGRISQMQPMSQKEVASHLIKNKSRFFLYNRQKHIPFSLFKTIKQYAFNLASTIKWMVHDSTAAGIFRTTLPILLKMGIFTMKLGLFVDSLRMIGDSFFTQALTGEIGASVSSMSVLAKAANITDLSTHSFIDLLLDYYTASSEVNDRNFAAVVGATARGAATMGAFSAFNVIAEAVSRVTNANAAYRIIFRMVAVMLLKFVIRTVGAATMKTLKALQSSGQTDKAVALLEKSVGIVSTDADFVIPKDIVVAGTEEAQKMIEQLKIKV